MNTSVHRDRHLLLIRVLDLASLQLLLAQLSPLIISRPKIFPLNYFMTNSESKTPWFKFIKSNPPPSSLSLSFPLPEFTTNANYIRTTKYTLLTFLPLNLYFQFKRVYNLYFLVGALSVLSGASSLGYQSQIVPLAIVLIFAAVKDGIEDYKRYLADRAANRVPVTAIRKGKPLETLAQNLIPGDIIYMEKGEKAAADAVVLSSSYKDGSFFIDTAELDGETNLKRRSAPSELSSFSSLNHIEKMNGLIQCELANPSLHSFEGRIHVSTDTESPDLDLPLTMNQLILKGSVLRNTDSIFGVVVYTGADTKVMKNLNKGVLKTSRMEKDLNRLVGAAFVYNAILLVSSIVLGYIDYITIKDQETTRKNSFPNDYAIRWYLGPQQSDTGKYILNTTLAYFVLYTYVIPISLFVTMEIVRLGQAQFMMWDNTMKTVFKNADGSDLVVQMKANNSNLNEDLGAVSYIFSDKTGTLTQNDMRLAIWYVSGSPMDELSSPGALSAFIKNESHSQKSRNEAIQLAKAIALCHDVVPALGNNGQIIYESQSPDESALLNSLRVNDVVLKERTKESITIEMFGVPETVQVLNMLEFTSTRKRMSVIVKIEGAIHLYCKGADNVLFGLLSKSKTDNPPDLLSRVEKSLIEYSDIGLRTLVIAGRPLSQSEYDEFKKEYEIAERSINGREEHIANASAGVEKELRLFGFTAIEDRLQDEVPETIAYLLNCNIHVWLLTGDKQQTAMNISASAKLLTPDMHTIILNVKTKEECESTLSDFSNQVAERAGKQRCCLVVGGEMLSHIYDWHLETQFIQLGTGCHSVICSRLSPLQKSLVVKVAKKELQSITLAIGDGANDVSMIQTADIGVGICGKEGTQAVRAADYAFGEFRHLKRLLAVHGRYSYLRLSMLILFSFYKNFTFITVQWWFGFVSAWSGQTVYDPIFFTAFNVLFTSLTPLFMGFFEKDVCEDRIKEYPALYNQVKEGQYWNKFWFITVPLAAVWHSFIVFGTVYYINSNGTLDMNGRSTGYWVQCYLFSTPLLVAVLYKAALMTRFWVWISVAASVGSVVLNVAIMFLVDYLNSTSYAYTEAGTSIINHILPTYYFVVLLIPFACVIPDLICMLVRRMIWPTDADIIAEEMFISNWQKYFKIRNKTQSIQIE